MLDDVVEVSSVNDTEPTSEHAIQTKEKRKTVDEKGLPIGFLGGLGSRDIPGLSDSGRFACGFSVGG